MKARYLLILLMLASLFISCTVNDVLTSPDERISGSGVMTTEELGLPPFSSVSMNTAGHVYVSQAPEQKVTVTVDDNIKPYIIVSVSGGKLSIRVKENVQLNDFKLTVEVAMVSLHELATTSAGSIEGRNKIQTGEAYLNLSSAGSIRLEIEAQRLYTNLSSAGNLYLTGEAEYHESSVSSAGSLYATDLATETTRISISSAGNGNVNVSKNLYANLSSLGSLYYKGNPQVYSSVSSVGRIVQLD
jgi:hypothetical protein